MTSIIVRSWTRITTCGLEQAKNKAPDTVEHVRRAMYRALVLRKQKGFRQNVPEILGEAIREA
jgi:hypothetical protein